MRAKPVTPGSSKLLWCTYARYPYMPRLASFRALADAISDGTANLNWTQETFAYADAHDGTNWVGVPTASHVTPAVSGLLVHPDFVPTAKDETGPATTTTAAAAVVMAAPREPATAGPADQASRRGGEGSGGATATQFYAQFDLDAVRGIKQLGEILEHVTTRLGPNVELSLEVRATNDEGYDDATQRIVAENASNLCARGPEFE
ncbi:MAG: hypothetical protein WBD02_06125 [Acidimicrobiia bacterium]